MVVFGRSAVPKVRNIRLIKRNLYGLILVSFCQSWATGRNNAQLVKNRRFCVRIVAAPCPGYGHLLNHAVTMGRLATYRRRNLFVCQILSNAVFMKSCHALNPGGSGFVVRSPFGSLQDDKRGSGFDSLPDPRDRRQLQAGLYDAVPIFRPGYIRTRSGTRPVSAWRAGNAHTCRPSSRVWS